MAAVVWLLLFGRRDEESRPLNHLLLDANNIIPSSKLFVLSRAVASADSKTVNPDIDGHIL